MSSPLENLYKYGIIFILGTVLLRGPLNIALGKIVDKFVTDAVSNSINLPSVNLTLEPIIDEWLVRCKQVNTENYNNFQCTLRALVVAFKVIETNLVPPR